MTDGVEAGAQGDFAVNDVRGRVGGEGVLGDDRHVDL